MPDLDVIVVGGGPADLTAGLYLRRGKLRTLILEAESYGAKIKNLELIENYPGLELRWGIYPLSNIKVLIRRILRWLMRLKTRL